MSTTSPKQSDQTGQVPAVQSTKQDTQPEHLDQAPASPSQFDQAPTKRKATEEIPNDHISPRPGTLPFMWNLPNTPCLPLFNADETDDEEEYKRKLELENDELIDELQETQDKLQEAEEKVAALEKRLRMYQVTVLPMDYKLTIDPAEMYEDWKTMIEREVEALKKDSEDDEKEEKDKDDNGRDKIELWRSIFRDVEWGVREHHRLCHQALEEIAKKRCGPGSCGHYKPGELPLFILDKAQMNLGGDIDSKTNSIIMSAQPPKSDRHISCSPIENTENLKRPVLTNRPDDAVVEAELAINGPLAQDSVQDSPRLQNPPLVGAQSNQDVDPHQPPQSSPNEDHLLETQKLREELARTKKELKKQGAKLKYVEHRPTRLDRYIEYLQSIHHRIQDDGDTIRALGLKMMTMGTKHEDREGFEDLLGELEASHAKSSEEIVDVAFEFQKEIDGDRVVV
ncbi:hypothetical protein B0T20DRAFT_363386 [Sordaria brevicollis]|uniref:Uncharacterized protein n=1 Tax=Sordaria brevicollis TaxID=83679 RepID=A0AAE0P0Y1_SORBR|nr:hypothetical protein B0T20DRAFT_363386 [Sordaria brevicollis]